MVQLLSLASPSVSSDSSVSPEHCVSTLAKVQDMSQQAFVSQKLCSAEEESPDLIACLSEGGENSKKDLIFIHQTVNVFS